MRSRRARRPCDPGAFRRRRCGRRDDATRAVALLQQDRRLVMTQGQTAEALASYRAGLAIATRLAAPDPASSERRHDLAVSHRQLVDALQQIRSPSAEQRRWLRESRAQLASLEGGDAASSRRETSPARRERRSASNRRCAQGFWFGRLFQRNR